LNLKVAGRFIPFSDQSDLSVVSLLCLAALRQRLRLRVQAWIDLEME
jgi:hypothetical protein